MKNHISIISISFILLIILSLSSCSKTLYYIYDEDGTREGYPEGYCSFEVKKKKTIYRGYSEEYKNSKAYEDKTYLPPVFIYLEGETPNKESYAFYSEYGEPRALIFEPEELQIKYINHMLPNKNEEPFCFPLGNIDNTISIFTNYDNFLYYHPTANSDSIIIRPNFKVDFCAYGNIHWFPPYLKKAKEIDYNQFEKKANLRINYKDPYKTVGDWGEPTKYAEKTPEFVKGESIIGQYTAFEEWVRSQIEFDEQMKQNGVDGWINVGLIIEKDGRVTGKGGLLSDTNTDLWKIYKQIQTIIEKSPKWKPAKIRKQPVRYWMLFHFKFNIPPTRNSDI